MTVEPLDSRVIDAERPSGYVDGRDHDVWRTYLNVEDETSDAFDPHSVGRAAHAIQQDICRLLSEDSELDARAIVVSVSDGEVILEGEVPNRSDYDHAEEIARRVSGVNRVYNRLEVRRGIFSELTSRILGAGGPTDHAGSGTKNSP